jgi:putative mRNA 3-end processing factor
VNALIRWSNGIGIRYKETRILLDPVASDATIPELFITHAHYDHSKGFQFPTQKKYSTKETKEIYEADTGNRTGNWEQIRLGRRVKLGDVEVEAHDAGHVLGSVQYEIITPEGNVVYASHINFTDTLLSRAAEVAPCEILVIEATFPLRSQILPPRDSVVAGIVKWALECVKERRIPAFVTEHIGNAQELNRIFNTWTELPVVVHPRIARVNRVYENNGAGLRYFDVGGGEAESVISDVGCVVIVPRRFDATRYEDFRIAYVTAWPSSVERGEGKIFTLSDQADLNQLLQFVAETRPKRVFTFRGGSKFLAEILSKRFGIVARELTTEIQRTRPVQPKANQEQVERCEDFLLDVVQVQDYTYEKNDLLDLGLNQGFKVQEIEEALLRLTNKGVLQYSPVTDGYSLSRAPQ